MKAKRSKQPTPVGEIVEKLLKGLNLEARVSRENLHKFWPQAVGEKFALHSWPVSFRGKTLIIGVADSLWMQEMSLRRQEILEGIARELGPDLVNNLRFQLGPPPHQGKR